VASEEINYRRFFNINELAAIRTEDLGVFEQYHQFILELIEKGCVQGLRIDHPDGLYDPPEYFKRLQLYILATLIKKKAREQGLEETLKKTFEDSALIRHLDEWLKKNQPTDLCFHVVVEKILERKESLPEKWKIHGTVGYDFLNAVNGLFVRKENGEAFTDLYETFIKHPIDFRQALHEKKKFFALVHMASEINSLGHRLDVISENHRRYRDLTRNNLTLAIREVIAAFPVYRSYITPQTVTVSERDRTYILEAVGKARGKTPALNPSVYEFLKSVLLQQ